MACSYLKLYLVWFFLPVRAYWRFLIDVVSTCIWLEPKPYALVLCLVKAIVMMAPGDQYTFSCMMFGRRKLLMSVDGNGDDNIRNLAVDRQQ